MGKLRHTRTVAAAAEQNAVDLLVVALLCSTEIWEESDSEGDTSIADAFERFDAKAEDIAWVTPVLEEHFCTYHSSWLAGRSTMVRARPP